jgi:hypothetical protein
MSGTRERRRKQLKDNSKDKLGYWKLKEKGTRSRYVENSLWKTLWACRETDYGLDDSLQSQPQFWNGGKKEQAA